VLVLVLVCVQREEVAVTPSRPVTSSIFPLSCWGLISHALNNGTSRSNDPRRTALHSPKLWSSYVLELL